MKYKGPDAWKKKIDPDFHLAVRTFLSMLREVKDMTDEGEFMVKDEFVAVFDKPENLPAYDGKEMESIIAQGSEELKAQIKNLFEMSIPERQKKIGEGIDAFVCLTEGLSEESKNYYLKKLELIRKGTLLKPTIGLSEDQRKKVIRRNSRELGRVVLSLIVRSMFLDAGEKEDDEEISAGPFPLSLIIESLHSLIAQIAFQSTVEELLKKGDEGNDLSLLRALRIDNNVVRTKAFQRRLSKARPGDKFPKRMGRWILTKPLKREAPNYETYIVLRYFWLAGLCKLNPQEELYFFLKECGVKPDPPSPETLDSFLTDYIRPLYKN